MALMKTRELLIAVIFLVISYLVLHFELWDKKWRVIIPMYIRKHVYLRLMRPIYPSQSVAWHAPSNRRIFTSDKIVNDIPNIVFIITDDLGLNDLSGGSGVLTPNIDSIRHNGLAFSQAYAGQATCAPSRGAMLTGRYPTRFGYEFTPGPKGLARILTVPTEGEIFQPILHKHLIDKLPPVEEMSLSRNETLISEVLQQYGYDTYYIGKWDSGPAAPHTPIDRGYNESLSFAIGASLYHKDGHPDLINGYGDKFDDFLRLVCRFYVSHNNDAKFEPDKYMTDYLSEQASNLIRSRTSTNSTDSAHTSAGSSRVDPFFLTLAYNAPHNPYQAMRSDYDDPEVQKLPTHFQRVYAAMIKALDRGVGQVLQALRDSGQYENTLVIFTNDNGGAHYANLPHINAPYRGWKATFFEGGVRMPLFMQWPARIQPEHHVSVSENEEICRTYASRSAHLGVPCSYRVIDDVVSHVDLFTSLVSLVHPAPQETAARRLDGLNLFDLIKQRGGWISYSNTAATTSDEETEHMPDSAVTLSMRDDVAKHSRGRALFWRSGHYSAMRIGDYKMHIALRPDKVWFFNLHNDPTEQYNIASELGVTNRTALKSLYNAYVQNHTIINSISEDEGRVRSLLEVFEIFEQTEAEQVAPSWPAASETPVTIDKVIGEQQEESDECIYWSN